MAVPVGREHHARERAITGGSQSGSARTGYAVPMLPRVRCAPVVFLATARSSAEDGGQDLGGQFRGFRAAFVIAAVVGPGASGMVCRPTAEKALAALGVLPAR